MLEHKKLIYAAGLLATSEGKMFGEFYKLLPFSDHIEILYGFCYICRTREIDSILPKANMTFYKKSKSEAICTSHWHELEMLKQKNVFDEITEIFKKKSNKILYLIHFIYF